MCLRGTQAAELFQHTLGISLKSYKACMCLIYSVEKSKGSTMDFFEEEEEVLETDESTWFVENGRIAT